jgi:uncharacterized membrane protein
VTVDRPLTFRVGGSDGPRLRDLLAADQAYHRAGMLRRIGVTALAVIGGAAWFVSRAREGRLWYLVLAAWLTLLIFTVGAAIAELSAWRRLHQSIEETRR